MRPAVLSACRRVPAPAAAKEALPPPIEEAALDRATPPCQDFFQFACGGWLARTEIPADRAFWHRGFAEIAERNQLLLRRILRLNGKLTLGENIADLGGLRLAFAAMQAARRSEPGVIAAVAGFSPDQQFFVGYAQSWCAKYREENLRLRAVTDPHSPARYRVNGPLSNMREFAAAFRCAEGTPMVRPAERRCEVW